MTEIVTYIGTETGHEETIEFGADEEPFESKTMSFHEGVTEEFVREDLVDDSDEDAEPTDSGTADADDDADENERSEQGPESDGDNGPLSSPQTHGSSEDTDGSGDAQRSMEADHSENEDAYVAMGEVDLGEAETLTTEEWVDSLEWPTLQRLGSHFDVEANDKEGITAALYEYDPSEIDTALDEIGAYDGEGE